MIPANAAPLAIALLGLVLGMRHATDPDHVIAVTTILSREHRLGAATRIGVIWGLGHTLTVLLVGAAIIIFKIAIPARLGLAMEFAVAIVLILLGIGSAAAWCAMRPRFECAADASRDAGPGRPCACTRSRRRDACHPHVHAEFTDATRRISTTRSSHRG